VADDLGRVDLTDLDTFAKGFPHGATWASDTCPCGSGESTVDQPAAGNGR